MSKSGKYLKAPIDGRKKSKGRKRGRGNKHHELPACPSTCPTEQSEFHPVAASATETLGTIAAESHLVPYDENLFERARTQWQYGDWESLKKIDRDTLQHHPDRAKLALLAAAGHLQTGNVSAGKELIRFAQDCGCSKNLVARILAAGVHNTLGRATAAAGQQIRAFQHFETAIAVGTPGADSRLLAQARAGEQIAQLGLPCWTPLVTVGVDQTAVATSSRHLPFAKGIADISEALKQQKADLDAQLSTQAAELISLRAFLHTSLKTEVANAAKQIQAAVGLQGYFATGDVLNINTERHSWPISPDFALYLIELLETNDYDLLIEFGSGNSTVIMAKAIAKMAVRRQGKLPIDLVSFDHLEQYYAQTLSQLKQAGMVEVVQLHLAPLKDYVAVNGDTYSYYDCDETLARLAQHHPAAAGLRLLVIVDGPPAATGRHARYPAGPLVLSHFKGAEIDFLLDDYIRDDEKQVVKLWEDEFAAANLRYTTAERKLEKGACLIAIAAHLPR